MAETGLPGEVLGRLSDFLRERRDDILAEWELQVRKVRAAQNLARPLLLDHMPQFLEDLAEYVAEVRAGITVAPSDEYPRIHAMERLELGYDLSEVVIEYAILRRAITDLAVHTEAPSIRSQELPRLHAAIDQAISTSVVRYTEARERTLRALDRISSAALIHHDVEALLPTTLDAFLETTASVDSVALALRDDEGSLRVRAAVGFPAPPGTGTPLSPDSFAARVAASGAPIFLRDWASGNLPAFEPFCARGTHALYGVPLLIGQRVIGVATMGSRSSFEFSQEDQLLFRTMVTRAAALIAQARLDAEVERRAAELEAVIESIPEAVYVGDSGSIRRANQEALAMLGYSSVEDLNRNSGSLADELASRRLDGSPLPFVEHAFFRALQGERAVGEVVVRHRKSGEDVVLRSSAAPIRLGNQIIGAVAVNTDITARMHEEAELRAALELRDRIFGVLSHDLRNPLSVVLTSAAMLQRTPGLEAKQHQLLQRVVNNAHRIERMAHDLLDYTRTQQARGMPIAPRNTDLLGLCHQVIDGMQLLNPSRTLRLSAEGQSQAPVDPERAVQVLNNLVANALRYSPEGTAIDIALREVDGAVELSVHNDGAPIPEEMLPRIFDAFQRGVPDESGRSAGLGLGLFIVQQIVEAHGGKVEVRSKAGEGTTFRVRWPK
jgi:PAS domain S-box-containing protein